MPPGPFLTTDPIDPAALLSEVQTPRDGAVALFVGAVRDHDGGRPVVRLQYEAYEPMAEKELSRIAEELTRNRRDVRVAIRHRIGSLAIGEVAVVVAAAAPHRDEAFAACRSGIEAIKARVPIWKKQHGPDGSFWVEPCGSGFSHESC